MKKALITGITGQDGSYLAEFLLAKGYQVHGIVRPSSVPNTQRVDHLSINVLPDHDPLFLHYGDLLDVGCLSKIIATVKPDEVYNLGAQSHVKISFQMPEYTGNITGLGPVRLLDALYRICPNAKFYQASSSEMFGSSQPPHNEQTPFMPRSPYAAAKLYAHWMTINYRESYGLFACNGILFNHESPRRGHHFVTKKITLAIADLLVGKHSSIILGNLDAFRDWGFAPDYVEAMWMMLQHHKADDFVIGTGTSYTVRDFITVAFDYVGITLSWHGEGVNERACIATISKQWPALLNVGDVVITIDPTLFRPTEVNHLRADSTKAHNELGWKPKIVFNDLVKIMLNYDLKQCGLIPADTSYQLLQQKGFSYLAPESLLYQTIATMPC